MFEAKWGVEQTWYGIQMKGIISIELSMDLAQLQIVT